MTTHHRSTHRFQLRMPSSSVSKPAEIAYRSDGRCSVTERPSVLSQPSSLSVSQRSNRRERFPLSVGDSEAGSDRFIPSRSRMNMDLCRYSLSTSKCLKSSSFTNTTPLSPAVRKQRAFNRYMLSTLYGVPLDQLDENAQLKTLFRYGRDPRPEVLTSSASSSKVSSDPFELDWLRTLKVGNAKFAPAALQVLPARRLPEGSYLQLDAPGLVDDFYLNLLSWSQDNILAAGLGSAVYLWNARTRGVQLLVDVGDRNSVTSVKWCTSQGNTHYLAVGTNSDVRVFDTLVMGQVYDLFVTARAASLAWNDKHHSLSIGTRAGMIVNVDNRTAAHRNTSFVGHKGEVCGLAWNSDGSCLASGSNDDTVCLWDASRFVSRSSSSSQDIPHPRFVLKEHVGAVKGLAWCPFRRNMLASGGGSKDRTIKLWNAASGSLLSSTDTGSQISSLLWGKEMSDLYSGHGLTDNQVVVWHVPTMTRVQELKGHCGRILSMDISPDRSSIVSAGADEVLRFWKVRDEVRSPSLRNWETAAGKVSFNFPVIR